MAEVLVEACRAVTLSQEGSGRFQLSVGGEPAAGARLICETFAGEPLTLFKDDRAYQNPADSLVADGGGVFPPAFSPPRDMVLRFFTADGCLVLTLRDSAERAASLYADLNGAKAIGTS